MTLRDWVVNPRDTMRSMAEWTLGEEPTAPPGRAGMWALAGLGLGAGLMFVLDPDRGRRRRALARDQVTRLSRRAQDTVDMTARDLANRGRGVVAEARAMFGRKEPVSDPVLEERVRAVLGYYVSHPGSISVVAENGRITLSGPIVRREATRLLTRVRGVRGVRAVESRLDVPEEPAELSSLQGGIGRRGERFELFQSRWSPSARLLAGLAGMMLAAVGARRRNALGLGLGLLGAGLAARGATNREMKELLRLGERRSRR